MFSFSMCQEAVSVKRPRVLLLNLSGIGFRNTSKMTAQSYSQGINQLKWAGLFRYSDWLSRYSHLKFNKLKICKTCCLNGCHGKSALNIKISQHTLVCHFLLNVLVKFRDNPSNLFLQKSNAKF